MMISTKGRYALSIMLDLAQHNDGSFVSLKDISDRQDISMKYLEAIIAKLSKGGLVDSARGKPEAIDSIARLINTPSAKF